MIGLTTEPPTTTVASTTKFNERIFHDGKQNGIQSQIDFESSFSGPNPNLELVNPGPGPDFERTDGPGQETVDVTENVGKGLTPPGVAEMVNPAALSIRHDGCLLENQEDYEFRRCTFNKVRLYKVTSSQKLNPSSHCCYSTYFNLKQNRFEQ